jgi:hypothetical protein
VSVIQFGGVATAAINCMSPQVWLQLPAWCIAAAGTSACQASAADSHETSHVRACQLALQLGLSALATSRVICCNAACKMPAPVG